MNNKKLHRYLQELRYIIPTLYFNFHYLPWRQAIKLPIVLYKPHLSDGRFTSTGAARECDEYDG